MTRTFHPSKTYKMSETRRARTEFVNLLVREGLPLSFAAEALGVSITTASRYYHGFADNCLPYNTRYGYGRDPRSVMYVGAACTI